MRSPKLGIILFICFLASFSVIVSKLVFFINSLKDNNLSNVRNETIRYQNIGGEFKNIIWLLQISDLHVSVFHDMTRISELSEFCSKTLDVIKPSVVLATGDLTDSNTMENGYTELEEEWVIYKEILSNNNVTNKVLWLDIRGNHDNYNVLDINSSNNYFRKYSVQGPNHPRSYFFIKQMENGEKVGLVGVDSCMVMGTKEKFNFFGELSTEEIDIIQKYLDDSRKEGVDYLIWFGHYPTSTIRYPDSKELRQLIADDERSLAYLSGHLHEISHSFIPHLYTYQKDGFFELELADWMSNRIFRVMSIDHGQFSFIDVKHGTWPIILVTNPKSAILVPPAAEPFSPSSTHIRILVFSNRPILKVELKINKGKWITCTSAGGPLFIAEWNQCDYSIGLHVITVVAKNSETSTKIEHKFSLDGSRLPVKFLSRLFLVPNLGLAYYFLFISSTLTTILPLIVYRCIVKYNRMSEDGISAIKCRLVARWARRMSMLVCTNKFYYPLFLYPIYVLIGPWAIIYLTDKKLSIVFAGGFLNNGSFTRSWMTYPIGWVQIIIHMFLIFHLARQIDRKCYYVVYRGDQDVKDPSGSCKSLLKENIYFLFVMCFQIIDMYTFWLSYSMCKFILYSLLAN